MEKIKIEPPDSLPCNLIDLLKYPSGTMTDGIGPRICRFCLQLIELDCYMKLKDVDDMVQVCAPEVDLTLSDATLICQPCLECLQEHFNFIMDCQVVEERLNLNTENTDSETAIKLINIPRITFVKSEPEFAENKSHSETTRSVQKINKTVKTKMRPFRCGLCPYKTDGKADLKQHNLIHKDLADSTLYKCDICNYKSRSKGNLKIHSIKHKTAEETEIFECNLCQYKTKHKNCMYNHTRIHQATTIYECYNCTFKTKHKGNMKSHQLLHQRPESTIFYECDLCAYKTKRRTNLSAHKLNHNKKEFLKCELCSYQTIHKSGLNRHMSTHRETFECLICPYKTTHQKHFISHTFNHKDPEKMVFFECEFCAYKTQNHAHLIRHAVAHKNPEDIVYFNCDLCPHKSKQKVHLKKHKATIHKIQESTKNSCGPSIDQI